MKNLYWSVAGVIGLALLVGCGGDSPTVAGSTIAGTDSTTGTATTSGSTTGGTTPVTNPSAGSYSGTYASAVFAQGGPSTTGPSGNSTLVIANDRTFTLTLDDQTVTGTLAGTGTASNSFTGTFTYDATGGGTATASVVGTVAVASPQITLHFSNYTDSSHANGTIYNVTVR